jgi:hypothetical protein
MFEGFLFVLNLTNNVTFDQSEVIAKRNYEIPTHIYFHVCSVFDSFAIDFRICNG